MPILVADNDPLNKVDPLGLRATDATLCVSIPGAAITTPGSPSLHQSIGTEQCPPASLSGGGGSLLPEIAPPGVSEGKQEWFYQVDVIHRALSAQIDPPAGFEIQFYRPQFGHAYSIDVTIPPSGAGTDGCSVRLADWIRLACDVHDYGYDLVRYAETVGVSAYWRTYLRRKADDEFYRIADAICDAGNFVFRNAEGELCDFVHTESYLLLALGCWTWRTVVADDLGFVRLAPVGRWSRI